MMPTHAARTAAVAALALMLSACTSHSPLNQVSKPFDLRLDDPMAYTACRDVTRAGATDDEERRTYLLEKAAAQAAAARSAALRHTVVPPVEEQDRERIMVEPGRYTVDEADLLAACEEVGFDPAVVTEADER
jgi:hypothetical protein